MIKICVIRGFIGLKLGPSAVSECVCVRYIRNLYALEARQNNFQLTWLLEEPSQAVVS